MAGILDSSQFNDFMNNPSSAEQYLLGSVYTGSKTQKETNEIINTIVLKQIINEEIKHYWELKIKKKQCDEKEREELLKFRLKHQEDLQRMQEQIDEKRTQIIIQKLKEEYTYKPAAIVQDKLKGLVTEHTTLTQQLDAASKQVILTTAQFQHDAKAIDKSFKDTFDKVKDKLQVTKEELKGIEKAVNAATPQEKIITITKGANYTAHNVAVSQIMNVLLRAKLKEMMDEDEDYRMSPTGMIKLAEKVAPLIDAYLANTATPEQKKYIDNALKTYGNMQSAQKNYHTIDKNLKLVKLKIDTLKQLNDPTLKNIIPLKGQVPGAA